jgi:hypothetical protein
MLSAGQTRRIAISEGSLMTTSPPTGRSPEQDAPSANRRAIAKTPIWVRVSLITAIILVGVLVATMVLGGTGIGSRSGAGHGSGGQMQMTDHSGAGGDHGANHDRGGGTHSGDAGHNSRSPN